MALFKRDLLTVNRRSEQLASHGGYVVLPSVFKAVQGPRLNLPGGLHPSGDVHGDKNYTHATEGQVLFWAHPIIPRTKESVRVRMSLYMVGGPVGESQESRRKVPVHSSRPLAAPRAESRRGSIFGNARGRGGMTHGKL